jgi:hypothetical protein
MFILIKITYIISLFSVAHLFFVRIDFPNNNNNNNYFKNKNNKENKNKNLNFHSFIYFLSF